MYAYVVSMVWTLSYKKTFLFSFKRIDAIKGVEGLGDRCEIDVKGVRGEAKSIYDQNTLYACMKFSKN